MQSIVKKLPYEPDLRKLDERFAEIPVGMEIKWAELADACGWPVGSARFKSITFAWRKRVFRDRNVLLLAVPGYGVKAVDPAERVTHASHKTKSHLRGISRAGHIVARTDIISLPDHLRRTADHVLHVASALKLASILKPKPLPPI